ncbi:acyl-CoA dehydrogenase [Virgisporangium ochraceum]|uniref:Acyl-CoA dehydrogenase n=1 Tax=Virgisporangium ochraceum TaxID=65505 RepID=A0A8J3ZXJ9_9ACTN|nr:acyl-CoA dehydrogenase [Virgisporangium ochraceum]GIJ71028.1 acyl-CoA dehydrogenase [Virgisporangium ochraceum]
MPVVIAAEQVALQESIGAWAARAATVATVREQEPGQPNGRPWERHWADLVGLGVLSIAVPEHAGGAGGSALDVAAAVESVAGALVPGPVMSTVLGGLLLAPHADVPAVKDLLPAIASGGASLAVVLPPPAPPGTASAAPGPASAPAFDRRRSIQSGSPPESRTGSSVVSATTAVATTTAEGGAVRLSGRVGPVLDAGSTTHLLVSDGSTWFLLDASHPGVRVEPRPPVDFSRSLGDVHLDVVVGADSVVPLDGHRVRDTAAMLHAVEAAAVAGWCLRTATEYAKVRHQFGRPIGSFQAVKHLCAGMLCRAESAAAAAWDAACAHDEDPAELPLAAAAAAATALDAAVDNAKDCVQVLGGIGFTWEHDAHLYLRRALALRQLLGGSTVWRQRAADLVLAGQRRAAGRAHAVPDKHAVAEKADDEPEPPNRAIAGWAVPTIERFGTDAQRERFVEPSRRGDIVWCQLFSEPEAGSDLAGLRTRAVRVDGGWRLTGQKVWTSLAGQADWAICLARTDFAAPKHKGLTYFLVAMRDPDIDIRPLREITGRSFFNEVFLDDVFVPDDCVVGDPGDGWRLARSTLAHERVAMGRGSALGEDVEALIGLVDDPGPVELDRLGALVASGLAVSRLDLRSSLRRRDGDIDAAGSAVAKLVGVAHRQAVAEAALVSLGPDGAAADGDATDPVYQFLLTRCLSIAGGTTQILSTVAAERVLGLPREER